MYLWLLAFNWFCLFSTIVLNDKVLGGSLCIIQVVSMYFSVLIHVLQILVGSQVYTILMEKENKTIF